MIVSRARRIFARAHIIVRAEERKGENMSGVFGQIFMGRHPCQNWIYKSAPTFISTDARDL